MNTIIKITIAMMLAKALPIIALPIIAEALELFDIDLSQHVPTAGLEFDTLSYEMSDEHCPEDYEDSLPPQIKAHRAELIETPEGKPNIMEVDVVKGKGSWAARSIADSLGTHPSEGPKWMK